MGHKRYFDLSISIESGLPSDPPDLVPEIEYIDHLEGAERMMEYFPGIKKEQLPESLGWAVERITISTHSGTHLDAPYHYHPTMDKGKPASTIDEIPLEWCFSDGVLLDFCNKADGSGISVNDIENELSRIDYKLKALDIVMIHVGADKFWGTPEYLVKGAGMTRESTLYLMDQGIKVVGIDAWSWDRPLPFLAEEFKKNGDPSIIWAAHFAGIEKGYCHMEKLANLDRLPEPFGFKICCFPIKVKAASAGWTRPVAIFEQ
ncbi:cyclase family protein [Thermodesulfobacteriota bacterium]